MSKFWWIPWFPVQNTLCHLICNPTKFWTFEIRVPSKHTYVCLLLWPFENASNLFFSAERPMSPLKNPYNGVLFLIRYFLMLRFFFKGFLLKIKAKWRQQKFEFSNFEFYFNSTTHSRFGHYFCSNIYGRPPRGPRGVKKPDFFSQIKLLSFCANIAPKRQT